MNGGKDKFSHLLSLFAMPLAVQRSAAQPYGTAIAPSRFSLQKKHGNWKAVLLTSLCAPSKQKAIFLKYLSFFTSDRNKYKTLGNFLLIS